MHPDTPEAPQVAQVEQAQKAMEIIQAASSADTGTQLPQQMSAADRIIGEAECEKITDLSRTTRWRLIKQGLFPPKVILSSIRRGWRMSAVLQWLAEREVV